MPTFADLLGRDARLALAVTVKPPARLAETVSTYAGQFYDRRELDCLAREISALYAARDAEAASSFRAHLDRRLAARERGSVAWDDGSGGGGPIR